MHVALRQAAFDPYREIAAYEATLSYTGKAGASATFIGTMRDFNDGRRVFGMTLEHYPGMTEKHLDEIAQTAAARWSLIDGLVLHRTGEIGIGEAIVVVAVWSAHRGDALDAVRFIIEDLKARAPFWKKERLETGEEWVSSNTSGYASPRGAAR